MSKRNRDLKRREFLKLAGCSLALIPVALIATDRATAQSKVSKETVKYQDTPKDGHKCVDCQFFQAPNACQLVEGTISPDGWCSLFAPKQS
ncbi:high-potential iron-sulfur protein [Microbulbifer hainanensis]|uniref:high-potential iron-sulfur protein n=1 Tax=Microbulbifer hainanensis TaxID=2735675 RepID=UPI0018695BE3|nr:high-potential iron-sulfur protein [Microbulbifer hainanensis]